MPHFTRSKYWHMPCMIHSGHGNLANWLQKSTSGSPYVKRGLRGNDSLSKIIIILVFLRLRLQVRIVDCAHHMTRYGWH